MAYNAGDVEAKLELDRSPFITGLKTSLREAEAWKKKAEKALKPSADIDQKPFNKALTAMQARLTKFAAKTYTAKVRIDDNKQLPKLTVLSNRLTHLGNRVVRPKVVVSIDSSSVGALNKRLAAEGARKRNFNVGLNLSGVNTDLAALNSALVAATRDRTININIEARSFGEDAYKIEKLLDVVTRDRKVYIGIELREFIVDYMRVSSMLDNLTRDRRVKVTLDVDAQRGMGQLLMANQMINHIDNRTINVRMDVDNSTFISKMAAANAATGAADRGMSRYTKRLIWLGAAISIAAAPALGTLTTLLATLPFVASAAGLSIGTVAAGMEGIEAAVAPLAASFEALKPPINAVFRDGLAPLVQQINTLMPMLGAAMVENAKVLVGWAGAITGVIMEFNKMGIIKTILDQINAGMAALTPMWGEATRILLLFAQVGAETFGSLVTVLNTFALQFRVMIEAAMASGVLQEAFRQLAAVTGALLYAFTGLMDAGFQAMVATGPGVTAFIVLLTNAVVALMPILSSLTNIFTSVFNPVLQELTPILQELQPLFVQLEGVAAALGPFISALAQHFGTLVTFLAPAVSWFLNLTTTVLNFLGPAAGPLIGAIMGVYGAIKLFSAIAAVANAMTWLFGGGMKAAVIASKAYQGAVLLARGATLLFSAALLTNPITWIVVGIVALIAAIVLMIMHWDKVTAVLAASWAWIKSTFDSVWGAIGTWLTDTWTSITTAFTASLAWIVNAWNTAWQSVGDFFTGIWNGIVTFFTTTVPTMWNEFVAGVGNAINAAIAWFVELPNNIAYWLGFAIGTVVRWAIDFGIAIGNGVTAAIEWFRTLPERIGAFFAGVGQWLWQTGVDLLTGLQNGAITAWFAVIAWFVSLPGIIGGFFANVGNWLWQTGTDLLTGLQNGIIAGWFAVIAWFVALPGVIGNFFVTAGNWLLQTGIDLLNGLQTGIVNGWNAVITWFAGLPAAIGNFFVNAGTWLWQVGADIVNGLWTGLQNAWNGFWGWVGGLVDSFIQGFKDGLGIASPSTIFASIGMDILNGLIQGLQTMAAAVWGFFTFLWTTLQNIAVGAMNLLTTAVMAGVNFFIGVWNTVWGGITAFFSNVWSGIQSVATTVWNAISAFLTGAINGFSSFWSGIWSSISAFFTGIWNTVYATVQYYWNMIKAYYNLALAAFRYYWDSVWNGIYDFFYGLWQRLYAAVEYYWNLIKAYYNLALAAFKYYWDNFWNSIYEFFDNLWNRLYATVMYYWNMIKYYYDGALSTFKNWWSTTWEDIKNGFRDKFDGIIQIAKDIWQNVKNVFRDGVNAVVKGVNWPIEKINGLFGISIPTVPELPPFATGGHLGESPVGPVKGSGGPTDDRVLARLSSGEHVWSAAEVAAAGGHDAVRKMRSAVLNGSGDATPEPVKDTLAARMNSPANMGTSALAGYQRLKLMDRFPRMDDVGLRTLAYGGVQPHVAAAGQEIERVLGRMPGGIGGVGSRGNVSDHPSGHALDFMTMSNSGLGDRVANHLAANWARMQVKYLIWKQRIANRPNAWQGMENRGSVTANHLDHVHASFLGGPDGGGGGFAVDYGAIFDAIAGPFKPIGEKFVRDVIPNPPLPDWIEGMGVGMYNKGWDGLRQKAIELMTAMGFGGGGSGGGNVEQWRPQVLAALQRTGNPASYADITLRRMNQESGGDPRAINNWDSNARKGTPSKGLMQVIDPTFAAYRDPGLPNNIWDPLANITASMRYAMSRYKSLPAAYNKSGGYDSGGQLQPGWNLAFNGTDGPEPVLTQTQWGSLMDTAAAAQYMVNSGNTSTGLSREEIESIIGKLMETRPYIGTLAPQLPQDASVKDIVDEVMFELRHTNKGPYGK